MKNLFYILIALLLPLLTMAQKKPSVAEADALFEKRAYLKAASIYEKLKQDQHVLSNLGDCYYNNSMMKDAARVYGQLFFSFPEDLDKEYSFRYAHSLSGINDIDKSDIIMADYLKFEVDTRKFVNQLIDIVPYNYEVQIMTKNTSNGDFGMSFFGDKVAFASTRNTKNPVFAWNDKPYLDLYTGNVSESGLLSNVEPFPKEINTKTHESSAVFSADTKTMYFNRTAEKREEVGTEKFATVKIMKASWIDGKWQEVVELPFCSASYSTLHPYLTKDGKRLYFSSDMPGSLGSFDIYYVDVNDDGTFGTPQNAGSTINTIHREQFPSAADDGNTLYFASDGHQGLGGLDIFLSKIKENTFQKPLNLGHTINSSSDDFGFAVDETRNRGYLSSNRKGSDNLYSFKRTENEENYSVEGDVKDRNTKELLPGTTITLYKKDGTVVGQMVVGVQADYTFKTEPNTDYILHAARDFYIPYSSEFTTNSEGVMRYTIELLMECYDDAEEIISKRDDGKIQIVLENIYFDFNKWDILPESGRKLDVLVNLMRKYPYMEIELGAHTDSRASATYNYVLSNRRAAATLEYLVSNGIKRDRLRSRGYGESVPLVRCGENCSEQEHSINRRCEFIILK